LWPLVATVRGDIWRPWTIGQQRHEEQRDKKEETYLPSESLILEPVIKRRRCSGAALPPGSEVAAEISGAEQSSLGWSTVQGILTKRNGVAISIGVVLASGNCIVTLVGQVASPFACF
jgi:hypothetical protein